MIESDISAGVWKNAIVPAGAEVVFSGVGRRRCAQCRAPRAVQFSTGEYVYIKQTAEPCRSAVEGAEVFLQKLASSLALLLHACIASTNLVDDHRLNPFQTLFKFLCRPHKALCKNSVPLSHQCNIFC